MQKRFSVTCGLLLIFSMAGLKGASAQEVAIALAEGQINGKDVCGLALDEVTEMLGRPSAVENNEVVASLIGVQLHYHPLGLSFRFQPESKDPDRGSWMMTVHLSKTWDDKFNEFFAPFSGTLSPAVNANWKATKVEEEFATHDISVRTADDLKKQLEAAGVGSAGAKPNHAITVDFGSHYANFIHENTTKFLETVVISCKSK